MAVFHLKNFSQSGFKLYNHFRFPSSSFNCLLRAPSEILRLAFDGLLHDAIACAVFLHIADLVAHHH